MQKIRKNELCEIFSTLLDTIEISQIWILAMSLTAIRVCCTFRVGNLSEGGYVLEIGEEFHDFKDNGKEREWKKKKNSSLYISNLYAKTGEYVKQNNLDNYYWWDKQSQKVKDCGTFLEFYLKTDGLKLNSANFCRNRYCSVCNWRRTMKLTAQHVELVREVNNKYEDSAWIFLTLTIKNCDYKDLKNTIEHMNKSFNRMTQRKFYKDTFRGHIKVLEITINREKEEFHPHFHILINVSEKYFKSRKYISTRDWVSYWRKALKIDYDPIVHVKRVRGKNKDDSISEVNAILETSKYIVKDAELISPDERDDVYVFYNLVNSTFQKRFLSYSGIVADFRKKLKHEDIENADLVHIDENDEVANAIAIIYVSWATNKYVVSNIVTPEEKKDCSEKSSTN